MTSFTKLKIEGWRQFETVDIDLSRPCVVLTGVNGSGKTTLLTLLSKHFGWNLNFVSTPLIGKRRARRAYSDFFRHVNEYGETASGKQIYFGQINYANEGVCKLWSNVEVGSNYQPNYDGLQPVEGLYIPSHRPAAIFSQVQTIPTNPVEVTQLYQQYFSLLSQSLMGQSNRQSNPALKLKESIIALAVFGEDSSYVDANPAYVGLVQKFETVLQAMLPEDLGFRELRIRTPDIVLRTDSGEFSIDSMSGGVNALFNIAWQIFVFSIGKSEFVISIDEPENHLHPAMQKTLLPNLVKAFPAAKFVLATHSPFIVSSYREASIVSLQRAGSGKIYSENLDIADISGTPDVILRDVLQVDSNLPLWVESAISQLLDSSKDMEAEQRGEFLLKELASLGIGDAILSYGGKNK